MRINSVNASTQRVVNQLSALSASKKQPKLLNLCKEDLIKHKTITNAWNVYQRKVNEKRHIQLNAQYKSIHEAMEDLKQTSPQLYALANKPEKKKKFPLDMRMPTDYPPTKPWVYNYEPSQKRK
ncbi:54S ribosomal protein L28, mitochondrial [[Candida] railenensis]|uniref:Large ribosomal subunit protein mL40 n=1 Tax=[Candida] railenensis TaxID=45579 RepID=A0A9P0VWW5_9ASCO|nr:54S ribosomal protein L28, mitochondrial [[Candida] railenensis]